MLSVGLRLTRGRVHSPRKRGDDRGGHLVLDGEDVFELPVVAFGPDMAIRRTVDQLHADADAVARFAHAALHHVLHAEIARGLPHVDRLALVFECGVAGDDEQVAKSRQLGDDILSQPVGEKFLLGLAAHVGEGQHNDRRLAGERWRCARRARLRGADRLACLRTEGRLHGGRRPLG